MVYRSRNGILLFKRAEGEVAVILSEGTVIKRASAANESDIPRFYGAAVFDS